METAFYIVPAGVRPFYLLFPVFLLLTGVLYALCLVGYGSQRASFVLSDAGLDFRGDVWGRRVPWSAVEVEKARVLDLTREPGLRPRSLLSPDEPDAMLGELRRRAGRGDPRS